jgi:hypothetical protein
MVGGWVRVVRGAGVVCMGCVAASSQTALSTCRAGASGAYRSGAKESGGTGVGVGRHPATHQALGGEEWLSYLERTRGHFDQRSGALLSLVSYAPAEQIAAVSEHDAQMLVSVTRDWIAHHHVEI